MGTSKTTKETTMKILTDAQAAEHNARMYTLTHEDILEIGTECCSTCDTTAFWVIETNDRGFVSAGIECQRKASFTAKLIEDDRAEGIDSGVKITPVRSREQIATLADWARQGIGAN